MLRRLAEGEVMTEQHVGINRDYWNGMASDWVSAGEKQWASSEPKWGIWGLPEAELGLLTNDMDGMEAIELGCGTGYVSRWMERRGAKVTGVDLSFEQLATARWLAAQHGSKVTFVKGNAEALNFDDNSFDFAISEYGAAIWCDPDVWLREAWRVLRPNGTLVYLGNHPLDGLCTPLNGAACDDRLHRTYRGLSKLDWTVVEIDPGGIDFNRTFAGWLDLFRQIGFAVRDYMELFAPDDATGAEFGVPPDWARRFPAEQVWVLEKL